MNIKYVLSKTTFLRAFPLNELYITCTPESKDTTVSNPRQHKGRLEAYYKALWQKTLELIGSCTSHNTSQF